MSSRKIHIAVLDTDIPCYHVYAKRGLYSSQFNALLTAAANRINESKYQSSQGPLSVHVTAFDTVGGSYPHLTLLRVSPWSSTEKTSPVFAGPIDAILVTGAAAAVYDDLHWIAGLQSFIERVYADYPLVKIFGSCFGHQLIGQALLASDNSYTSNGSSFKISVEATSQGHEIGMHSIALNPSFVSHFPPLARFYEKESFNIQLIHGDAVISWPEVPTSPGTTGEMLPESWLNVGSSIKCPIQGLYKPGRVLTLQGHFEFDAFATAELCYKFANKFRWSQELLDSHLENIRRSVVPGREDDDDSKVAAEAVLLFFAGDDKNLISRFN
jgi:GMP synthase-like glutamine amidotransferase